jgi:hypothetical protein
MHEELLDFISSPTKNKPIQSSQSNIAAQTPLQSQNYEADHSQYLSGATVSQLMQFIHAERTNKPVSKTRSSKIGRVKKILRLYASLHEGKCSRESPFGGNRAENPGLMGTKIQGLSLLMSLERGGRFEAIQCLHSYEYCDDSRENSCGKYHGMIVA